MIYKETGYKVHFHEPAQQQKVVEQNTVNKTPQLPETLDMKGRINESNDNVTISLYVTCWDYPNIKRRKPR